MSNIFKAGNEFNNLAQAFNGMNVMVKDLMPKIDDLENDVEFIQTIYCIAYFARKGVWDRLEKYDWPNDEEIIIVPTISKNRITITQALIETVGQLLALASEFEISNEVQEIMDNGPLFFEIERYIPDNVRKLV